MQRFIILVLVMLMSPYATGEEPIGLKSDSKAPPFELKDAEEKVYQLEQLKGKVVLLIMGNRKIRKDDDLWAERIQKIYGKDKRLELFIVADMRSVPRFIPRSLIRSQLRRNKPPARLLLDWGGKVHQAYHTKPDKPNLFLIDPRGKVVVFMRAKHTEEAEAKLRKHIDSVLPDPSIDEDTVKPEG